MQFLTSRGTVEHSLVRAVRLLFVRLVCARAHTQGGKYPQLGWTIIQHYYILIDKLSELYHDSVFLMKVYKKVVVKNQRKV